MPAGSSSLNRRALEHLALRRKKNKPSNNTANATKKANKLIEMKTATSSSPTGVKDFVSEFALDTRCDDTPSSDKQKSIELQRQHTPVIKNTSHGIGRSRANNGDDDTAAAIDDDTTASEEKNQSIDVQNNNSPVITSSSNSNHGEVMDDENSKPNQIQKVVVSPITGQIYHVNVSTRKYHQSDDKAKTTKSIAPDNTLLCNQATTDNTALLKEKTLLDDTVTVNETVDVSRFEDEGFIDRIEGFFLNGIEGLEDGLASLVPACISPSSAERCQLFEHPLDV